MLIPYPHTFSGRRASQSKYELTCLINLLKEKNIKRYLEIGAREGDTFHEIVAHIKPDYALAVDLPGGLWGKASTKENLVKSVSDLKSKGFNTEYLFGDSGSEEVVSHIQNMQKFDALFIDGDHTLEGVTRDWENYRTMADMIIFHDIVGYNEKEKVKNNKVEVPILWEILKTNYNHVEFIDQDSNMGIGVIFQ